MGRQKAAPKKKPNDEVLLISEHGFRPIVKKRGFKRKTTAVPGFHIVRPSKDAVKLHLGKLAIGHSNNILSESYSSCKAIFHDNYDTLKCLRLEIDKSTILVQVTIDTDLLKDIIKAKIFAMQFIQCMETIYIDLYFLKLPLAKFGHAIGESIKAIISMFYNISHDEEDLNVRIKREYDYNTNNTIFDKIRTRRSENCSIFPFEVQHPCLKPILRPYQVDAVRWMIHREKLANNLQDQLDPLYTPIKLSTGVQIFFDKYSGYVELEKPLIAECPKGGILADEMGLGKTVEVLACILTHKNVAIDEDEIPLKIRKLDTEATDITPVIEKQNKRHKVASQKAENTVVLDLNSSRKAKNESSKKSTSLNRAALTQWYKSVLDEHCTTKPSLSKRRRMQCICGNASEENTVNCLKCGKSQHIKCMGFEKSYGAYICPQCWLNEPLIESDATLIVTPLTLRKQWCSEICKHITSGLRVLYYEGPNSQAAPVYPMKLNEYDLVITTYNVLQAELKLSEVGEAVSLRQKKKYSSPGSPLTQMNWWRLCLDEAQTVETPGKLVSQMARKLSAKFRWAVTGTPISKEISDLYGLIDYLQITPYNNFDTWKHLLLDPYSSGEPEGMYEFLSEVLWRSSKIDVLHQINIPEQTFEKHILDFSPVERYFYQREHQLSCDDFFRTLSSFDENITLESIDKASLKQILAPLSSLRESCTQPNTKRGRYLVTRKRVTSMEELLDALILKNLNESEESLRGIIASLNGLAGISLLLHRAEDAISHYREALQLVSEYSKENIRSKLHIDKLQVIHIMHNLAEVLDTTPNVQPTLRDGTLRDDCDKTERLYIEKFLNQTLTSYKEFDSASEAVSQCEEKFVLNFGEWYTNGINWISIRFLSNDFEDRLNSAMDNNALTTTYHSRSAYYGNWLKAVGIWDDTISDCRSKAIDLISKIYKFNAELNRLDIEKNVVDSVRDCHLRPQKTKSNTKKKLCLLCLANNCLKKYESKLYVMKSRKGHEEDMALIGSWKPSHEEVIMKCLVSFLKQQKITDSKIILDGETHITMIEAFKKEFKEMRKFWTYLDQQICATDELEICKMRLQIKEDSPETPPESFNKKSRILQGLSYTLDNKLENINFLSAQEIDFQQVVLTSEVTEKKLSLEKSVGTQAYLATLKKQYEGGNHDPCPICQNDLETHWSVLHCGHCFCLECIQKLLESNHGIHIQCSICRNTQKVEDITHISLPQKGIKENVDTHEIKGNFSAKINGIVRLLLKLREEDEDVQVLIFSTWIDALQNLKAAIDLNGITVEMALVYNLEARIEIFKDPTKKVTALLMPLHLGSKGLNLIEATHVILVEPVLNPADELQAIGRVHRIGQTRPTVVHKFLIKHTIEENLDQATTSNSGNWEKNKITLKNLIDLFSVEGNTMDCS